MTEQVLNAISVIKELGNHADELERLLQLVTAQRDELRQGLLNADSSSLAKSQELATLKTEVASLRRERDELLAKISSYDAHPDVIEAKRLKREEKKRQLEEELAKLQAAEEIK